MNAWRRTGIGAWLVLLATLVALYWLHGRLEALLDFDQRVVIDDERFYAVHRWYLIVATVQWLAGLVAMVWLWRSRG